MHFNALKQNCDAIIRGHKQFHIHLAVPYSSNARSKFNKSIKIITAAS